MSVFETAIQTILKNEGGYVNNPQDPGGATNYGISLRFLKSLNENHFDYDHNGIIDGEDIHHMPLEDAKAIYKKYFWDQFGYSRINSQQVAVYVFDMSVNMSPQNAHKVAQRAVWAWTKDTKEIIDDGNLGPKSIAAINAIGDDILPTLRSGRNGYYREIIAKKPVLATFKNGWKERTYAI